MCAKRLSLMIKCHATGVVQSEARITWKNEILNWKGEFGSFHPRLDCIIKENLNCVTHRSAVGHSQFQLCYAFLCFALLCFTLLLQTDRSPRPGDTRRCILNHPIRLAVTGLEFRPHSLGLVINAGASEIDFEGTTNIRDDIVFNPNSAFWGLWNMVSIKFIYLVRGPECKLTVRIHSDNSWVGTSFS